LRKESSDKLNPEESESDVVSTQHETPRGVLDYVALALATFGVGYLPIAPGTLGSMVGVLIFLATRRLSLVYGINDLILEASLIVVITLLGIWAASQTERLAGRKDPGKVVVDEVAGQMISLFPLILFRWWPVAPAVIISFILFRFFDIVKPYPARRFERLHSGLGIMADDLVAGVYGAIGTVVGMFILVTYVG
jgi:phosphatidylglycerophosphatase A